MTGRKRPQTAGYQDSVSTTAQQQGRALVGRHDSRPADRTATRKLGLLHDLTPHDSGVPARPWLREEEPQVGWEVKVCLCCLYGSSCQPQALSLRGKEGEYAPSPSLIRGALIIFQGVTCQTACSHACPCFFLPPTSRGSG